MSFDHRDALAPAAPDLDAGPAPAAEPLVSLADATTFGLDAISDALAPDS